MSLSPQPPASFPPLNQYERDQILEWAREIPLVYGPWKPFKRLYKDAENAFLTSRSEPEIFAALLCRIDAAKIEGLAPNAVKAQSQPTRNGYFQGILANEDAIYMAQRSQLFVFDARKPFDAQEVKVITIKRNRDIGAVLFVGEKQLLVQSHQGSCTLFSIENPLAPQEVATIESPTGNIAYCNGHLIFTLRDHLAVYDVPTQSGPLHEIARLPFENIYNSQVSANSRYAAMTINYGRKLVVVDLLEPQKPRKVGEVTASGMFGMAWKDDLLVISESRNLAVYRVTANEVKRLSNIRTNTGGVVTFRDNLCVVMGNYYSRETTLIDLSQPHNPVNVGVSNALHAQSGVFVGGGNYLWAISGGLSIYDVSEIARPSKIGQPISADTLRYMKRRGRRILRMIAEADQPSLWPLAETILRSKTGRELDLKFDWIAADLLFGRGHNWRHARSGHGDVIRRFTKFSRKQREERAPQLWDAHLDFALEAAQSDASPRFLLETARKVLASNNQPVPAPSNVQLEKLLTSESAAVKVEAARAAVPIATQLDAKAVAPLLWVCNQTRRREVLERVKPSAKLAKELATTLSRNTEIKDGLTRRGREIALLLAARFDLSDAKFSASGALDVIPLLMQSGEAPVRAVGLGFSRRIKALEALELVQKLETIPQNVRASFIAALEESAASGAYKYDDLQGRVRHENGDVRRAVWRLARVSSTPTTVLQPLWRGLFAGIRQEWNYQKRQFDIFESAPMQTALSSDDALEILTRIKFEAYEIPSLQLPNPSLSTQLFAAMVMILPIETVCYQIATMPEEVWNRNTPLVASHLEKFEKFSAKFWTGVLESLEKSTLIVPLQNMLRSRTFANTQIARSFGGALTTLSPAILLSLIGSVEDELWNSWRGRVISSLKTDAAKNTVFWEETKNFDLSNPLITARVANDAEFAALFETLDSDVWEFDQPALESLIVRWLGVHEISHFETARFATHPLTEVRSWALSKLETLGLNVPLALKLLESNLRDSMNFAIAWFEKQTQNPVGLALALCDSPRRETREYGRIFVRNQLDFLIENGFLEAIQENPNAEMQAFIADLLLKRNTKSAPDFDKAVLRGRNRARFAKNLVQKRLATAEPLRDDRTLLELARGKTPRDADFALAQLAKRAIAGENIEGVEVSGVGGI